MTNSLDAPMDRHNAEKILNDALQADEFIRQNAERAIKTLIQTNFSEFVNIFGQIMLDSNTQPKIRRIASIVVKNSFHSTNSRTQRNFENNWFACPLSLRTGLVDFLEQSLNLSDQNILGNIAKILGSIVRMNMVRGETPGHFKNLYRLCSSRSYAVGVLKAVSTACNQLYDETTFEFSYEDQSAVYKISTMYLSVDIADVNLLTTTLDCLADTFEIFGKVIDEQTVREDLLYRLMACKDHGNEIVVAKTLNAINRFVDAYGNAFDDKLPYLCQMNLFTFNTCSEQICMEGFAFWELLCVMEKSELVMRFLPILLEKVLLCLTKEDPEDREWSTHKAAASLLSLLTSKYGNALLKCEVAQKFIAAKFQLLLSEEHAIGAVALGSICESGCAEYLYNVVGYLITDLGNPVCENEALFALAKICEKDLSAAFNFLPTIVDKCGVLISNHSDSSINAVWVYNAIFCSMRVSSNDDTFSLINYHYTNIIQLLLTKFGNLQSNEHDLRNALLVTLSEVIPFCPPNLNEILKSILAWLSKHIQDTLRIIEGVTREQLFIIEDVMSSYVVLLSVTLEELKAVNIQDVLDLCIQILQSLPNKAHGEVYIMVSSLLQWFVPNVKVLMPCILRDLSSRDAFISDAALNLLSTTAIHMEDAFSEFTVETIPALINAIASPNTSLQVKPRIIGTFGEIALAIGRKFEPYIEMAMVLFKQISSLDRLDDWEYVDSLIKSVIVLFDHIIMAVGSTAAIKNILNEVMSLIGEIVSSGIDYTYQYEVVVILSDINKLFPSCVSAYGWTKPFLESVLVNPECSYYTKANDLYKLCF